MDKTIGRIVMKFGSDIYDPQRKTHDDFGDPLTVLLVPPTGQSLYNFSLRDRKPQKLMTEFNQK